jgi:hypothetical protein
MPTDYFSTGSRFVYKKTGESQVIFYSFGTDLTDDGGNGVNSSQAASYSDSLTGDMVFLDTLAVKK